MIHFFRRHTVLAWALSVLLSFVILIGFMFIGDSDGINILSYCFTNLMLCFFLYAVSGKEPFERCGSQLGYVMKNGWPVLVFPLIFFFFGIVGSFTSDARLNTDWPVRLGMGFLLMMLAGLSEELGFRAVASDALLPRLRNTRHPYLYTAAISGLVFGLCHVILGGFDGWLSVVLGLLKICTTAVFGASMMILYWKTRDVLAIGILHGLYDLLPSIFDCLFVTETAAESAGYTSGDIGSLVIYLIQLAVDLLVLRYMYKKVGTTIDYRAVLGDW